MIRKRGRDRGECSYLVLIDKSITAVRDKEKTELMANTFLKALRANNYLRKIRIYSREALFYAGN